MTWRASAVRHARTARRRPAKPQAPRTGLQGRRYHIAVDEGVRLSWNSPTSIWSSEMPGGWVGWRCALRRRATAYSEAPGLRAQARLQAAIAGLGAATSAAASGFARLIGAGAAVARDGAGAGGKAFVAMTGGGGATGTASDVAARLLERRRRPALRALLSGLATIEQQKIVFTRTRRPLAPTAQE